MLELFSLRLIKHLLIFFYVVIKHSMRSVEPFILRVCVRTNVGSQIPAHQYEWIGIIVEVLVYKFGVVMFLISLQIYKKISKMMLFKQKKI